MKNRKPNAAQIARQRLAKERGAVLKDWGGRLPIAIVLSQ